VPNYRTKPPFKGGFFFLLIKFSYLLGEKAEPFVQSCRLQDPEAVIDLLEYQSFPLIRIFLQGKPGLLEP